MTDKATIQDNARIIERLSKAPKKGDNAEMIETLREESAECQARLDAGAAAHQERTRADERRQAALRGMWGNHAGWKYTNAL